MKRRALLWTLVVLLVCVGLPVWLVQRQIRQERLDTALYTALDEGQPERALELLREGADPDNLLLNTHKPTLWETLMRRLRPDKPAPHQFKYNALTLALIQSTSYSGEGEPIWADVIKTLLKRRAERSRFDPDDRWLNIAVELGNRMAVRLLLEHGADVNRKDDNDIVPLMQAATVDADMVKLLLERGAEVNARDKEGQTALHWAIARYPIEEAEEEKMVKVLLAHGANVHVLNQRGESPLKMAQTAGLKKIVKVLKDAGATR